MTEFKHNSQALMKRMRKSEAVLLDAVTCPKVAAHPDVVASVRRGLDQAKKGLGHPARNVTLEVEWLDRLYLNGYIGPLATPGGLVNFMRGSAMP